MNLLSLYHFFAGKASDKQKEAIKRWAESSPDNYETLCREKKIFDAGILLVDKKELFQKENAPLLYKLINYTVKIAAVVLLVVVSVTIYKYQELVKKSEVLQTILVPAGQRINIILPDSTFVCLNSNTKFSYPSVFATNNRKVKLDGEAYFEVARNHEKPFMVKSPAMDVRVLGTSFNIKCRPDNSFAETTLIEGEVEVKDKSDKGRITLLPGQKAVLNRVTGRMQVKQVDPKMEIVWHNDLIPFEKSSIFQIAAALERFYGVKIILSPDVDNTNTYSGVLKKKDNIESVLNSLRNSIPFNYKKVDDNNIFISSETK